MVFKNTQDHVQGIDWSLWITSENQKQINQMLMIRRYRELEG